MEGGLVASVGEDTAEDVLDAVVTAEVLAVEVRVIEVRANMKSAVSAAGVKEHVAVAVPLAATVKDASTAVVLG